MPFFIPKYDSLRIHDMMLSDSIRTQTYQRAIETNVKDGDIVVDVGTGTGILALFAAKAGAKKVYAIEPTGIIDLAEQITKRNGFSNRIEFIKAKADYGAKYDKLAKYYDITHKEHPYKAQTDFADMVFQKCGNNVKRVLDICCGTGEHARRMIEKGYYITGIDLSDEMLAIAKRKFLNRDKKPSFIQKDVTKLDFDEEFDGAYLFNAFIYMTTYEMAVEAFKGIWCSLKKDGIFTFDVFNGWQMLDTTPHMHIFEERDIKIIQFEHNRTIDKMRRVKHLDSLWLIEENGSISLELNNDEIRVFFYDELMFLLESSGFEPLAVYGEDLSSEFTADSRFITFVAKKLYNLEKVFDSKRKYGC